MSDTFLKVGYNKKERKEKEGNKLCVATLRKMLKILKLILIVVVVIIIIIIIILLLLS
jgi:hypothetical protein